MCVYCKDSAECVHERDACAASRGDYCDACGHASSAIYRVPSERPVFAPLWPRSVAAWKPSKASAAGRGRKGPSSRGDR